MIKFSCVSLVALTAMAAEAVPSSGWYGMVNAGYGRLDPRGRASETGAPSTQKLNKAADGFDTNLIGGYEKRLGHKSSLGMEAYVGTNTAETKQVHSDIGTTADDRINKIKIQYRAGVSINPTMELSDKVSLALKLGVEYGRFDITHSATVAGAGYTKSKDKIGAWAFVPGVRLLVGLNECWAVTGDISYAMYNQKKSKDLDPTGGDSYRDKVAPHILSANVGLRYKF